MSWNSKVVWSEGLFLRPHHLQQNDRYLESLIESRVRHLAPYPWGFSNLEIDRDSAQRGLFSVRRASGIMPDGTPFDIPAQSPVPGSIDVAKQWAAEAAKSGGKDLPPRTLWLTLPQSAPNSREVDAAGDLSASRWYSANEHLIDSTARSESKEEIEIAHPRLAFELGSGAKPGYVGLPVARVIEVGDQALVFDERFAPPLLTCSAHPVPTGWIDRVIGWIESKLEELARYAADPTAGGGLQSGDYFMLQVLNRHIPVLKHLRGSRYVHPERLFEELLRIAGELATFATTGRRAQDYPAYDHDNLDASFDPVLRDIQHFLSAQLGLRAIRLELIERAPNAFISTIRDRNLFRNATLVIEVSARRQLTEIQNQFPHLFKVGPNTKMNEIVHAHLPGVPLVHLPTPPSQIRAISDHVYFRLDRNTPLWPEFSVASSIGLHFAGDWTDLQLELWAVYEGRR